MELTIVVPTYNDVQSLVRRISEGLNGIDYEVLFVDDSKDRTPQCIAALMRDHSNISMIHRDRVERRNARATANLIGIRQARGEYVCLINADLQHPPEVIAELLVKAKTTGADIVYASRYMAKGRSDGLDNWQRKLISVMYGWAVRILFFERIRKITDPASGFFLVRKAIVEGVALKPIGFKILLEILMRCQWDKAVGVPYEFQARAAGKSKANFKQGTLLFEHLARLLVDLPEAARFWKFLAVGASGTLVNLLVFQFLLGALSLSPNLSWVGGWFMAATSNFILNYNLTWKDRKVDSYLGLGQRLLSFWASRAVGAAVNFIVFRSLLLIGTPALLAVFTGICLATIVNFVISSKIVFKERKEKEDGGDNGRRIRSGRSGNRQRVS